MASQRVSIDPKNLNIPTMNYAGILQDYGYSPTESEWLADALIRQGGYRLRTPYYGAALSLFSKGYGGLNREISNYAKSMIVRQAMKKDKRVKTVYDFIYSLHEMKRERSETIKALIGDNSMADYMLNDFHHIVPDDPTVVNKVMDEWIDSLPIEALTQGGQSVYTLSELHKPTINNGLDTLRLNMERQVADLERELDSMKGREGEYYAEMVKDYQWALDFMKGMTDEQHDMINQFSIWGHRMGHINSATLESQFYAHFFGGDLDTNNQVVRTKISQAMQFLNDTLWGLPKGYIKKATKKSLMAGESAPHQIETQAKQMLLGGFGMWWHNMMALSCFHQNNPDVKCIRTTPNNIMYYSMDIQAVRERVGGFKRTLQLAHIQPLMSWVTLKDFSRAYMTSICDEALRLHDIGIAKQKMVERDANKATLLAINESMDALRQIYENLPVETYIEDGVEYAHKTMTTVDYNGRVMNGATGVEAWLHTSVGHLTNYLGALAVWDGVTNYPRIYHSVSKSQFGYRRGENPTRYDYEETEYEGLAWAMDEFQNALVSLLFEGWENPTQSPFDFAPRIKTVWNLLSDENAAFLRPLMVSVNDSMRETKKQQAIDMQKATIEQAQIHFQQAWEGTETVFTHNTTFINLV